MAGRSAAPDQLTRLSWLTVGIPLTTPLRVGSTVVNNREYCCVQATLADGSIGDSFVLTRGLDVGGSLRDLIGPALIGASVGAASGAESRLRVALRNAGWDGPISRAASAVFLAALDATAKERNEPAWMQLTSSGSPPEPQVVAPIGYTPIGEDATTAELDEAARAVEAGVSVVKLMGGFDTPDTDLERVRRVRDIVGDTCGVALDVNGGWPRDEAVAALRRFAELDVAFVEEPWAYELGLAGPWPAPGESPPLAFGEVSASAIELEALASSGHVRFIRPDASLVGGPQSFLRLLPSFAANGCELMPHYWPEIHRHFAAAYPGPAWVEATLEGGGEFGLEKFVHGVAYAGKDLIRTPTAPGFGYSLDWIELNKLAGTRPATLTVADA